ncbi:neurogenic locus notch homolog protein 1-like isoform X2 [Dreissena polymorpha]|uniref:neurogenic locus notch homolog protein 1-like isoform X2 n=1 Tax=Dreissena polymorpha TaxID=45954 RepID=UPI002263CAEF|nr:neurogenic locus notch homolog protein 1-like isoform X2 [Dreissena polymorpha]
MGLYLYTLLLNVITPHIVLLALCNPACQNGGTCVSPYRCQCPEGYYGLRCENETGSCTLEAGQNVTYWNMSHNTQMSETETATNGSKIHLRCPNTDYNYSDYYCHYITNGANESKDDIECVDCVFEEHGLKCELDIRSLPESSPSPSNCTAIDNGQITDHGKSFTCNPDYKPAFKNGTDAILYTRYSCTCYNTSGRLQCMGAEVECKPIGCKIPANVEQGMTIYDPKERRNILSANRYEIQHGQFLIFTCEPSDVFYFEPNRRMFECVKGSWAAKKRPHMDTWDFGNNGSFPECRKVKCLADYCKFGGHCIRDHECQCPEQTSGKQCQIPLCSPDCKNGGTCVSPDTCKCIDGFHGLRCENDIDECSNIDLNDCHRFSNCTNTPGSYTCKCIDGYVDLDDNRGRKCAASCTLEAGQNVTFWKASGDTQMSEGDTVAHGTRIRVKCPNTGFDYSDFYNNDESPANIECVNGVFTDHGLKCESDTMSTTESSPSPKKCTKIENGLITDRGKSFTCNADYKPSFKNGMDAILYARYSCTCNQKTGRLQCMGTEVECKPIGCTIPANVQQGMTLFDPKERRTISAANRYEIHHGQFLTFTCEPSDVFYFEPNRRMFECVKGSWFSKKRSNVSNGDSWDFGNNGSFPECRKVICPADYCKFGGHCHRDNECLCPAQTSGKQCETPLCSPECKNNGTCESPDTCHCLDGFYGVGCENDIDECRKSDQNDCHHFSNCTNTPGSYTCKCIEGYVDHGGNNGRKCAETCEALPTYGNCDAAYCRDKKKNHVCTQGQWTVTNLCLKGKRECSTNESLVNEDSTLSVSSQYYDPMFLNETEMFGADQGRLNSKEKGTSSDISFRAGIWASAFTDKNQHIQVKFTVPKTITGIETRGRPVTVNQEIPQWVEEYRLMYSKDCVTFNNYTHTDGSEMV